MNVQKQKIIEYLNEIKKISVNNSIIIKNRIFFETWQKKYKPEPFRFNGKIIEFLDKKISLPKKSNYIVYLTFNLQNLKPEIIFETKKNSYHYEIGIKDNDIIFSENFTNHFDYSKENPGEIIEVVYDIINQILNNKKSINIGKLTKKEFINSYEGLKDNYDDNMHKKVKGLSLTQIKALLNQAAQDMAIDDLSTQLSLPVSDTYAYIGNKNEEVSKTKKENYNILGQTWWDIAKEIEIINTITKINYEIEKHFVILLNNCEIIKLINKKNAHIKIPDLENFAIKEDSKFLVCSSGIAGSIGIFIVKIFDYDTVYGEILLDEPLLDNIRQYQLVPNKPPQKTIMENMNKLFDLFIHNPIQIKGALRYLSGLENTTYIKHNRKSNLEMDFSQRTAFESCIDPDNKIVIVQGPPGTGKTWVLVKIIKYLCKKNNRILVTAPSNTAVDNICLKINELPVLRFGYSDKIHPEIINTCWYGESENTEKFLSKINISKKGYVFAATHSRSVFDKIILKDIQKNGLFDVVVFDEAGMSKIDEFLLCSHSGKRIIVFGDQQQLPPFPLCLEAVKKFSKIHKNISNKLKRIINLSGIEYLSQIRKFPLIMLQRTYRCQNPRLMRFSSTLFYSAKVITSEKAEYFRLPYHERQKKYPRSTLRFYTTSLLPDDIRNEKIIIGKSDVGIENNCEAVICKQVLLNAVTKYSLDNITVITPYKKQVVLLRNLLKYDKEILPLSIKPLKWNKFINSRISTVDSFQGGESDIVIISYVRSNNGDGIGFIDNPNRINVAHTRCRREIIIIGDLECLKRQARNDIFKRMERAFKRDGEIINADKIYFQSK